MNTIVIGLIRQQNCVARLDEVRITRLQFHPIHHVGKRDVVPPGIAVLVNVTTIAMRSDQVSGHVEEDRAPYCPDAMHAAALVIHI